MFLLVLIDSVIPHLSSTSICSESEGELTLQAGDYLLVWGSGEPQGGYFDAELLDGRRGLVPGSFVQRLIGKRSLFSVRFFLSTFTPFDDSYK